MWWGSTSPLLPFRVTGARLMALRPQNILTDGKQTVLKEFERIIAFSEVVRSLFSGASLAVVRTSGSLSHTNASSLHRHYFLRNLD
jgi:hypothetical protein